MSESESATDEGGMQDNPLSQLALILEVKAIQKPSLRPHYRRLFSSLVPATSASEEKGRRKAKVREHVQDFVDSSSLHGLKYVFDKRHTFRRGFWFVITVAAFVIAVHKVYQSTVNYFNYPFTSVKSRRFVDHLPFPAVSFCNLNDMRMSKMEGTMVDQAVVTRDPTLNITGEELQRVTLAAAHELKEMVVACIFNGESCSYTNFTKFHWSQGDTCFTFNSGKSDRGVLSVEGAGRKRSLELTINIQHYDYYRDGAHAGVHLILHDQNETPVKIQGPIIPPGFTTYVEITKIKHINLPSPYKTHCGKRMLEYFDTYSMHTCWLEQLTKHVYDRCQCKDHLMPGKHLPVCTMDRNYNCTWPEWDQHREFRHLLEAFDKLKLYDCPLPCEIDSYEFKTSRSLYPSSRRGSHYADEVPELSRAHKNSKGRERDSDEFMRDNLLRLVVYYDDLSYEVIEQKPSYDTLLWLGDVGGQIGLFLGAGVMTYFEFLDCIGMILYTVLVENFKTKK